MAVYPPRQQMLVIGQQQRRQTLSSSSSRRPPDPAMVNELQDWDDYSEFVKDVNELYKYNHAPHLFFKRHIQVCPPTYGGYGVVNFVYDQKKNNLLVVKALRDLPKRDKELYWLWRLREFESFSRLFAFFRADYVQDSVPPASWTTVDVEKDPIWSFPKQLYIVLVYYPYKLEYFIEPARAVVQPGPNKRGRRGRRKKRHVRDEDIEEITMLAEQNRLTKIPEDEEPQDQEDEDDDDQEREEDEEENSADSDSDDDDDKKTKKKRTPPPPPPPQEKSLLVRLREERGWNMTAERLLYVLSDSQLVGFIFELFYPIYWARWELNYFQHLDLNERNIMVTTHDPRTYLFDTHGVTVALCGELNLRMEDVAILFLASQGLLLVELLNLSFLTPSQIRKVTQRMLDMVEELDRSSS